MFFGYIDFDGKIASKRSKIGKKWKNFFWKYDELQMALPLSEAYKDIEWDFMYFVWNGEQENEKK